MLVASADFNGDLQPDYALILKTLNGSGVRVVAALSQGKRWGIVSIRTWSAPIGGQYVRALEPGHYKRTRALDGPVAESGELLEFTSKRPGFVTGTLESSGAAYFLDRGKWVHVWVSD